MSPRDAVDYSKILQNGTTTTAAGSIPSSYEDNSQRIVVFHSVLPAVTLVFLLLRNYSRFFFLRAPGWDDLLLNLAWIFTAIMEGLVILETKYGLGKHIQYVPVLHRMEILKLIFICQIIYFCANLFAKTGLAVFYLRLAVQGTYRQICYGLMVLNLLVFLGSFFASIFLCNPVAFFWDRRLKGGKGTCGSVEQLYVANACLNMLMDVLTLIVPIPIVWGSPALSKKTKIKISVLFLLGIVTCVCSVLRVVAIRPVAQFGTDVTWMASEAHKWSTIELDSAIIAACIPAIKPLVAALMGIATPIPIEVKNTGSGGPPNSQKLRENWQATSGAGGITKTSVSALGKDCGREHRRNLSRQVGGRGRDDGMGEHILLEETVNVSNEGKVHGGAWSSMDSIITTTIEARDGPDDERGLTGTRVNVSHK